LSGDAGELVLIVGVPAGVLVALLTLVAIWLKKRTR